jgi:hypothetical protein
MDRQAPSFLEWFIRRHRSGGEDLIKLGPTTEKWRESCRSRTFEKVGKKMRRSFAFKKP